MKDSTPIIDRRPPGGATPTVYEDEETLVTDARATLTPSQMVEQRLIGMLKGSAVMVSHIQRRLKPGPR